MRKKRAFYNLITSIVLQIVSIICGLIVPKLIIATYGSNLNGLINSITQFLSYITLLEVGFGPVILSILYKPIANKDKSKIKRKSTPLMVAPDKKTLKKSVKSMFFMVQTRCEVETIKY